MAKHLYLHVPTVIASGQINDNWSGEYPAADIPVKSLSADIELGSAVRPGMTVIFGSAPGLDDLGRNRVRRVFSNDELLIGYSPRGTHDGELDIEANDYFTIWDEYRVWSKTQRFVYDPNAEPQALQMKDYDLLFESHGSGTLLYPKANAGPARAGTIDRDTGVLTLDFDASDSYSMPLGVGIASYAWDFADGTVIDGGDDQATATVTFPPGFRYIYLTVTDEENLEHTMAVPVYARDPGNDTCVPVWEIENWNTSSQGQTLSVRILSDLPRSTYPDGCVVMMFDDGNGPEHYCDFYGWHHTDRAGVAFGKTGALRDTVLECLDIAGKLDTLPGQAQLLSHAEEPANWSEMYRPSMYMMIDYLLRWHSTALELADWSWPTLEHDYAFIERESSANTLYAQVQEQARAIVPDHSIGANRRGQLVMRTDPMLQALISRTSTVQATVSGHIHSISLLHQRPPRVHWIRAAAVVEGWDYQSDEIEVEYSITPSQPHSLNDTTLFVEPIPTDIASGTEIFLIGQIAPLCETTAPASAGATSLSVTEINFPVNEAQELRYTVTEQGPPYVPTQFCIAPGRIPGQGAQAMMINNRITQSDATLQMVIGMLYARLNSEWGILEIELAGDDDFGIDPAEMTWIRIGSLAERYIPQRLLNVFADNPRLLPLEVNRSYRYTKTGRVVTIRIRAEVETSGPPATEIEGNEL